MQKFILTASKKALYFLTNVYIDDYHLNQLQNIALVRHVHNDAVQSSVL